MNKKTLIALAVVGAMGALTSGGVSALEISAAQTANDFAGIVAADKTNIDNTAESININQTAFPPENIANGVTAIGRTAVTFNAKDVTVTSNSYAIWSEGLSHSLTGKDFVTITSTSDDAVYAGSNGTVKINGGKVTIDSQKGGNTVKAHNGTLTIKGSDVTLKSGERGTVATKGSGNIDITATNLTIDAKINNTKNSSDEGDNLRYRSAVSAYNGVIKLTASEDLTVNVANVKTYGDAPVFALASTAGGKIELTAKNAVINGDIASKGELNLNGNLIFNGKTADIATLGGNKATITLTDKNQTLDIGTNNNNALTIAADNSVASTIKDLQKMAGLVREDGSVDTIAGNDVNWFIDGSNGGYDISLDAAGNEVKVISQGTKTAIRGGQISGRLAVLGMKNDVRKRLGDIRHVDAEQGAWVRYEGGRMSASGFSNKLNTLQIGYDTKALADGVRLGAAVSYTRNDAELVSGAADADMYTMTLYGTWMGDNGMYADVIGRVANVKNDITIFGTSNNYAGDLNNTIYSVSGEFGQRFDIAKTFFVEPQVEVIYSYVTSDSMKLDSQKFKYDSVDSLIGRAGMVFGWNCPNDKGHVYFRASALKEFKGDSKLTTSVDSFKTDGKDTWAELGLGAQYNVNKNVHVWADVERTQGAEVNEDFRGTLGVRVSF